MVFYGTAAAKGDGNVDDGKTEYRISPCALCAGKWICGGKEEGEGPLGKYFDAVCEEPLFGEDTWEAAESALQRQACVLALG